MTSDISKAESEMKISLQSEIASELEKINDEIREELLKERKNISSYYDDAISKTKSAIKILKENNANEEVARLESELSKLVKDYQDILSEIDKGLESMNQKESNYFRIDERIKSRLKKGFYQNDERIKSRLKKGFIQQAFGKKRVQYYLHEALCFVSNSVLADSLVLRYPLLRQAPKRYAIP